MKLKLTLILLFSYTLVMAQNIRTKENRILPVSAHFAASDGLGQKAALSLLLDKYKVHADHELNLYKQEQDNLGFVHYRYVQRFRSFPVEGAMYILHQKEKHIYMANGDVYQIKSDQTQAALSESTALQNALQFVNASTYYWQQDSSAIPVIYSKYKLPPHGELVWAPINGQFDNSSFRLCYKFDIYAILPFSKTYVYVDAENGKIIWHLDGIQETNVNGTTVTKYSGTRTFQTDSTSATNFRLRDTSRGADVVTLDKNKGTSQAAAVDFIDADNYWNNINANKDEVAGDVHWGTQKVYDYYWNAHGRNSYDGNGGTLTGYVHHGNNYVNAFWDGTSMNYGDGNSTYGPLVCIDVVAHELTHGVTSSSANLIYSYESGALNESFSDIFGNTVEFIEKPLTANWKMGEELTSNGAAFRNMANPNQYGDPDTYLGTSWYTGTGDNGGVHTNSGVQNFWYYILTVGDTATNDNNNAYSVPGLGMTKAAAIAYRNLTTYLTPNSQYADARYYAIQSAADLYGNCSPEVIQTTNAWYAVGVGPKYDTTIVASFTATPTASCNIPQTVQFNCTSANAASATWVFGDGGTSNQLNPTHTYNAAGQYNVKMVVTSCSNVKDSITIANYIKLDSTSVFCDTTYLGTSGTIQITDCAGVLVDNGGGQGNYSDNISAANIRVLSPANVSHFDLQFVDFATENTYDFVKLYDGSGTTAPLIGNYTGTTLPNSGNWMSTSDTVFYLRLTSDTYVNDRGFVLKYQCQYLSPTANFYSPDTTTCSGNASFTNTSIGALTYAWTFGDGGTSTQANPTHSYAAPGNYTVRLIAFNGTAADTLTRVAYIKFNPNLSSCNSTPLTTSSNVTITDCFGLIVDNGGLNGNYSNNVSASATLSSTVANYYKLKFLSFNTQASNDLITVYDGPSAASPILGQYSGTTLPNGGNYINSSSPNVFITFTTNSSVTAPGFQLQYECAYLPCVANFYSADTVSCDSSIHFTNTSQNASSNTWYFGDGTSSTANNPTHNYPAPGYYSVTLISCNPMNCDTLILTNYIFIDPNNPYCYSYNQPISGINTISGVCNGVLFDDGGPNAYYSANINNSKTVIVGQNGQQLKLNFKKFNLIAGDTLRIYDGNTTAAPLIAQLSTLNANLPNDGKNIWSSGNKIMLEFKSNASNQAAGFEVQWTCALRNDSLNFAVLNIDTVDYCINRFEFSQSGIIPSNISQVNLFPGNGGIVSLLNPTQYIYLANGNYIIKLDLVDQTSSYFEYDTLLTNRVFADASIPTSAFKNQLVNFVDLSINGGLASWYANNAALGTGSPFGTSFGTLGAKTIMLVADNGQCTDTFIQNMNILVPDAVRDLQNSKLISVYPNPASSQIVVHSNDNTKLINLILYDKMGRIVLRKSSLKTEEVLDVSSLARGVYSLRVELDNKGIVYKKVLLNE